MCGIFQLSVKQMETYPSAKIMKILPRVDPHHRKYLADAYRFILKEKVLWLDGLLYEIGIPICIIYSMQKLWPEIEHEIMLYDYLFDQRHRVKEEEATMIIALLMDLQEDFRYAVKRAFIKYILRYVYSCVIL